MRPRPARLFFVTFLLVAFLSPGTQIARSSASQRTILVCTFSKFAYVDEESAGKPSAYVVKEEAFTLIFAGLDTAEPAIRGNLGESRLDILRRDDDALWLMERPVLGGVNIFSIFRNSQSALMSKQYQMPSLDKKPYPFGVIAIAACK